MAHRDERRGTRAAYLLCNRKCTSLYCLLCVILDRRTEKTDECENKISQHDRKKGEKTNEKFNENR